jgi:hypothetical protein
MNSGIKMFLLAAVCSVSLLSCKKDYDCDCTISVDLGTGTPYSISQSTEIEKTSKKGAEGTCDNIEDNLRSTFGIGPNPPTINCKID